MHKLQDAATANENSFQQGVYLNTLVSRPRSGSVVIMIRYVGAVGGQIGFVHIPIVILEIEPFSTNKKYKITYLSKIKLS